MFNRLLLLCRPGFEKECAGEIMTHTGEHGHPGFVRTDSGSGIVQWVGSDVDGAALIGQITFSRLIFARQWFAASESGLALDANDRLPALLAAVSACANHINGGFNGVDLNHADTNEGKSLSRFLRRFRPHLERALQQRRLLDRHSRWRLHLLFHDSCRADIGLAPVANSSPFVMGIPRLKMPRGAPSRSTLKLDEALRLLLTDGQRQSLLKPGMRCVDLGAAPGGWSWQMAQRGLHVTAIDNGAMQAALMQTGLVEHLRTDAFTFQPERRADWLLCDMAERPLHVSRLIARWFEQRHCRHAIFNLKLPMKKRLATVQQCLALLDSRLDQAGIAHAMQARQLYHDREEITVRITTEA